MVYHGIVNMKECTFLVKLISSHKWHPSSYVQIQRTLCIQPNRVPVKQKNYLTGKNVVSPVRLKSEWLGSHTLGIDNTTAMIFINYSGTAVRIKKETVVRKAEVYAEICQEEKNPSLIRNNQTSVQVDDLPEHLIELCYRSTHKLNDKEKCRVNQLQVEYQDIFFKHDSDFGCLTSVTQLLISNLKA